MSTEANKTIIRRYIEQLNRRNDAIIEELVAEDVTVSTLHAISGDASGPSVGRDVVRQEYRRNTTAFPDYQVTVEQLIAEGDIIVMH
jgi:predicted ester cyclase